MRSGTWTKELSEGYRKTTNNRMELMAAIAGLASLTRPCQVMLYSDSKYLVDANNKKWIEGWKKKGWKRGKGEKLANVDLWQELDRLRQKHEVSWHWVKGHDGHAENERCDELATAAADGGSLRDDTGFEAA